MLGSLLIYSENLLKERALKAQVLLSRKRFTLKYRGKYSLSIPKPTTTDYEYTTSHALLSISVVHHFQREKQFLSISLKDYAFTLLDYNTIKCCCESKM